MSEFNFKIDWYNPKFRVLPEDNGVILHIQIQRNGKSINSCSIYFRFINGWFIESWNQAKKTFKERVNEWFKETNLSTSILLFPIDDVLEELKKACLLEKRNKTIKRTETIKEELISKTMKRKRIY